VVEFALVLPIVAAFVLTLLQFGRVLYAYVGVTHLANEAARYAAVNRMPGGATTVSGYVCPKFGDSAGLSKKVTVTFTAATPTAGDGVSVKVSEDYQILSFWHFTVPVSIPVSYTASMRLEQVPTLAAEATSC
jgi:Flp pilus assembly protein TadG